MLRYYSGSRTRVARFSCRGIFSARKMVACASNMILDCSSYDARAHFSSACTVSTLVYICCATSDWSFAVSSPPSFLAAPQEWYSPRLRGEQYLSTVPRGRSERKERSVPWLLSTPDSRFGALSRFVKFGSRVCARACVCARRCRLAGYRSSWTFTK
jgi:hypothetical protein